MSGTRLSGRRKLVGVKDHLDVDHRPGVYLFYKTWDGPPRYVGRSGASLYGRIRGRGYTYYQFKHCRSDYDAYKWECRYWHLYEDSLVNSRANGGRHPAHPQGTFHYCPVCD